jgi:phage baseplate assembly protein W
MTTQSPGALGFGQCWGTPSGSDLSMPSYMASGITVVAEAILRRWQTDRGGLIDDPNYGYNVFDLVNADLSPTAIDYAQQQMAAEAEKDERVQNATVSITLTVAGLLTIVATILTALGPFKLVCAVSATSVSLLLVTP